MQPNNRKLPPIERALAELKAGRLWRAKEILSGYLGTVGYVPEVYAAYGRVLAEMHDSREAGKFLFLSGIAAAEEQAVVDVYLAGIHGKPYGLIFSGFPSAARRRKLEEYPARVRSGLVALGFPEDFDRMRCQRSQDAPQRKASNYNIATMLALGGAFFVFILVGLLHGISVVLRWLFAENNFLGHPFYC